MFLVVLIYKFSAAGNGFVYGVYPVTTARVPVLKVVDQGTEIECDISVENWDGISKSKMIYMIGAIDERFRKLSFLVKYACPLIHIFIKECFSYLCTGKVWRIMLRITLHFCNRLWISFFSFLFPDRFLGYPGLDDHPNVHSLGMSPYVYDLISILGNQDIRKWRAFLFFSFLFWGSFPKCLSLLDLSTEFQLLRFSVQSYASP